MSEYLKCPLCGAPLELDSECHGVSNYSCYRCDYEGPSVSNYTRRNVIAIQEAQNALIADALERARKGEA
jgi:hypothetical protein